MITLRKLEGLPERTRGRKLVSLLAEPHDEVYARGLVSLAREILDDVARPVGPEDLSARSLGLLRHRLSQYLGIDAADWDLQAPPDRTDPVIRHPLGVWLDDLRSPFNVGSVIRTAEAFGFTSLAHSPATPGIAHPRTLRSAMGAAEHLAITCASLDEVRALSGDHPVFALELGGTPLHLFDFPARGLVLIGGEELGLSPEALAWADQSYGRVSIPLYGRKASLNVGVAFGILAAAWVAQIDGRTGNERPDDWV